MQRAISHLILESWFSFYVVRVSHFWFTVVLPSKRWHCMFKLHVILQVCFFLIFILSSIQCSSTASYFCQKLESNSSLYASSPHKTQTNTSLGHFLPHNMHNMFNHFPPPIINTHTVAFFRLHSYIHHSLHFTEQISLSLSLWFVWLNSIIFMINIRWKFKPIITKGKNNWVTSFHIACRTCWSNLLLPITTTHTGFLQITILW